MMRKRSSASVLTDDDQCYPDGEYMHHARIASLKLCGVRHRIELMVEGGGGGMASGRSDGWLPTSGSLGSVGGGLSEGRRKEGGGVPKWPTQRAMQS